MTSDLRVLYLAPSSHRPGQLSRYSFLDEEIRALADAGVDVYVLSGAESSDWDQGRIHVRAIPPDSMGERAATLRFAIRNLRHTSLANMTDFRQWYRSVNRERLAAQIVEREGVSLIHSYFGWPRGFGGYLAKASTGVPLVAGLRGSDVNTLPGLGYGSRLDPSFDRAFRRLLRAADRTISVSEFLRRQALQLGASPDTAHVILKGVRLDRFRPAADGASARADTDPRSEPMLLAVSGLVSIKGLNHVLDALAILRAAGHRFTFVVCGEGTERGALQSQAVRLGLQQCCRFAGRVSRNDISAYFAGADVFVHGSLIEASGNVLLEAMASGLPIVCTDAGGPAEYVSDGVTGFVVPIADPHAMADRLRTLLDDAALRREFGRAGRLRAETCFPYARMIDDTLKIYRGLVGAPAGARTGARAVHEDLSHA